MLASTIRNFAFCWKSLARTDITCKIIAFAVLTPIVGFLFRLFVVLSGRAILADVDIAYFFLHRLGWLCCIVVGGAVLGVLALEQSALLGIAAAAGAGKHITTRQALRFSWIRAHSILRLTGRIVALILMTIAPFAAVGAGLY